MIDDPQYAPPSPIMIKADDDRLIEVLRDAIPPTSAEWKPGPPLDWDAICKVIDDVRHGPPSPIMMSGSELLRQVTMRRVSVVGPAILPRGSCVYVRVGRGEACGASAKYSVRLLDVKDDLVGGDLCAECLVLVRDWVDPDSVVELSTMREDQ